MKDVVAAQLLGSAMCWKDDDIPSDLRAFQVLAGYKYDRYGRFEPGRKFIDSFALWLRQFSTAEEREAAFNFVKDKLIFISDYELGHLARIAFPLHIKPAIRARVGEELGIPPYRVAAIEASDLFRRRLRETLFLGLSDGARIDAFRRSSPEINHEQVYGTYEVRSNRLDKMFVKLCEHLPAEDPTTLRFSSVFLIDDISASGTSLIRWENDAPTGRLNAFAEQLKADIRQGSKVFAGGKTRVYVLLYIATNQALEHIDEALKKWTDAPWEVKPEVVVIQKLTEAIRVSTASCPEMAAVIDKYYDPAIQDEHTDEGKTLLHYGFASCALPLVLAHNTPNNSIALIWADGSKSMKPLFPRKERHVGQNRRG